MKKLSILAATVAGFAALAMTIPARSSGSFGFLQSITDTTVVSLAVHVGTRPTHTATSTIAGGVVTSIAVVPAKAKRSISVNTRTLSFAGSPGQSVMLLCPVQVSVSSSYSWTLDATLTNDFQQWSFMGSALAYRMYVSGKPATGAFRQFTAYPDNNNQSDPVERDYGNVHNITYCVDLKLKIPSSASNGDYYSAISYVLYTAQFGNRPTPTPLPTATPTPMPVYPATILADKPIIYYHMDEAPSTSGFTLNDASGNGNGAIANPSQCPAFQSISGAITGYSDAALQYGVSNCEIPTVSYHGFTVTGYSVESWFLSSDGTHSHMIYRGSYGVCQSSFIVSVNDASLQNIGIASANKLAATIGDYQFSSSFSNTATVGVTSTANVLDGKWHHIVATWAAPSGAPVDPAQFKVYVDGVDTTGTPFSNGTSIAVSPIKPNTIDLSSGLCESTGQTDGSSFFDMGGSGPGFSLDEYAVYDYALTSAQVLSHYHAAGY